MEIGDRIKGIRLKRGKTLLEVANVLGVSEATVQRYESGNIKNLKLDTIGNIAGFLNVNPAYLMGWSDTEENYKVTSDYTFYSTSISAGIPIEVDSITQNDVETITIPDVIMGKWAGASDIYITRINGDSMNNIMPHGSMIAVKQVELENLKDGDVVVYSENGDYSVKKFYNDTDRSRLIFKPDSTDNSFTDSSIAHENASEVKIHGKVVLYIVELD